MPLEEIQSYNALAIHYNSDYKLLSDLYSKHSTWRNTWRAVKHLMPGVDTKKLWAKILSLNIRLILQSDPDFPPLLKEIPYPPLGLYIKGDLKFTKIPGIAIVGTRRATLQGKDLAKKFADKLARQNFSIISGLALGIDAAAHTGAIKTPGITAAVLACGLDNIYPSQHESLANQILETGGALISEYPIGTPSLPYRFIERNRIVSGLSRGILIIEAPRESGALATARFALDQNREVFVVPGPITNLNYYGSHELIKSGATLVTDVSDILRELGLEANSLPIPKENISHQFSTNEKSILHAVKNSGKGLSVDKIIEITKLEPTVVNSSITFLILEDAIKENCGIYEIS